MGRLALGIGSLVALFAASCGARTELYDNGYGHVIDWGDSSFTGPPRGDNRTVTDRVDLLIAIDNSGSMNGVQSKMMLWFDALFSVLQTGVCVPTADPRATPRRCTGSADETPVGLPLRDVHVGVVSTDLGTPDSMVPGCDDTALGDDGRLNPIRNGPALASHLPWAPMRANAVRAPEDYRPAECTNDRAAFPSFIRYCSNTADASCDRVEPNGSTRDASQVSSWFRCYSGMFINGCGLEAQLESVWRALLFHDASDRPDNTSPNAGFLRQDAVLAIVVFSDEEDGSARNCRFDQGFSRQNVGVCRDGTGVYNTASLAWAHPTNPDLRFYLYEPGRSRDPTWDLDRYANTARFSKRDRWNRDLWSLKPGRPDRVVFAAVTGVPLTVPMSNGAIDFDRLLGAPAADPDAFYQRNSSTAITGTQAEAGPFSMMQGNMSPTCSHVVPACREEGTVFDPAMPCSNHQYQAFPSRRIVEVARRFAEDTRCGGQPCDNGFVSSVCARSYEGAMREIGERIARRMAGR